ncbi:MAG: RNA methyltransferase [Acidobacteriota bacterium]
MPTKERIEKIKEVLSLRQLDLRVVLENIKNVHNASALLRTCDAAGVLNVDVVLSENEEFSITEAISTGAEKWLQINYFKNFSEFYSFARENGYKIISTCLCKDSIPFWDVDYSDKVCIIFGNEREGVSEEALKFSDYKIKIPMLGMVRSLNVSVSAGIILYEAIRQRNAKKFFESSRLQLEDFKNLFKKFISEK